MKKILKSIGKKVKTYSVGYHYENVRVYRNSKRLKENSHYYFDGYKVKLTFMPRKGTNITILWGIQYDKRKNV